MWTDEKRADLRELEERRAALIGTIADDKVIIILSDTSDDTTSLLNEMGVDQAECIKQTEELFDERVRFASGRGKDFQYLTGFEAQGWVLILDTESGQVALLAPALDSVHALFEGAYGVDEATAASGISDILTADKYRTKFQDRTVASPLEVRKELARLRAIKSSREISILKEAVRLTTVAFAQAQGQIAKRAVKTEYQVEAKFTYTFRFEGAHHGYEPIVAGGRNALTLHYAKNSEKLPDNGLVLIDIGARFQGYSADITRTYAVGTPTRREAEVHAAVEKAHLAIIDLIRPGLPLQEYQDQSDTIMKEALKSLGLLKKPSDYRKYFPHAISHGLGTDVHESLGGFEAFQPGMVLTVEPGIYISEEGIGIRIEDDILVTEHGHENLSAGLPTGL